MTKHRTITGGVAIALLAVAATAATMRSHGIRSFDERWVEVSQLPTEGLNDRSQVFFERAKALSEKDGGRSQ